MRSFLQLGLLGAATSWFGATAHPHQSSSSPADELVKRASYTVTTGVQGSSGIQPRLEIRQLQEQSMQWDLFILALRQWMDTDNSDATGDSYYGIAGIHGVPEVTWGGSEQCSQCNGAYGYCNHISVVFPGWHRAYLALFEQELVENAISVAKQYTSNQAEWVSAAEKLRVPFWDWAAKVPSDGQDFPPVMTQTTITVTGPRGSETIANPLYQYKFANPSYKDPYSPFNNWEDTLRYPDGNAANAQSQNAYASQFLRQAQPSLQEQTYNLLSNCPEWQSFSNTGGGSAQCSMSIEGIHNRIHSLTGGVPNNHLVGGHMAYLPVAAFDAAFWLHHANVDRLLALWQTVYPEQWGASQGIGYETWTYPRGYVQDANSDLTPFRRSSNGEFHTLNSVRDYATTFNYQYPEFLSTDGSQESIRHIIAAYYGPNATLTAGSIPVSSKSNPKSPNKVATGPVVSSIAPSSSSSTSSSSVEASTSTSSSVVASISTSSSSEIASSSTSSSAVASASAQSGKKKSCKAKTKRTPSFLSDLTSDLASAMNDSSSSSASTASGLVGSVLASIGSLASHPGLPAIPELATFMSSQSNTAGVQQEQYVANIVADNNALGSTYSVCVFNGAPDGQAEMCELDPNFIGSVVLMSHGVSAVGPTYGAVPLTFFLQNQVNAGKIPSMNSNDVLPWLTNNLDWRVVGTSGEVPLDQVPGLSVAVYSSTSKVPTAGSPAVWAPVQPQLGVTAGKQCGASTVPDFVSQVVSGLL